MRVAGGARANSRCRWLPGGAATTVHQTRGRLSVPPAPLPPTPDCSIPRLRPARNLPSPSLQQTTLPNGFRVLSQESYGSMTSTVALFVDAGSMYETDDGAFGSLRRWRHVTAASAAE